MPTSDPSAILKQLAEMNARLAGLTSEIADVRADLAIQFARIAALQAELDLMPAARRHRRDAMRAAVAAPKPGPTNGDGGSRP